MANLLRSLSREPLHPPTTHFPIALYPMAVIFDLLSLTREDGSTYTFAAFVVMIAASAMAGAAMITGFIHLIRDVSPESNAWRVAILHMSIQLGAAGILIASLVLRFGHANDAHAPMVAIVTGVIGTVALLAGGWLGGRLVYTHAVGVRGSQTLSDRQTSVED